MKEKIWEGPYGEVPTNKLVFIYRRADGQYNISIRGMDLEDIRLVYESLETTFPLCKHIEECLGKVLQEEKNGM